MIKRDIVVLGSSAGGVEALIEFVGLLPKDFDGTIFIVQHLAPYYRSHLHRVLDGAGPLKAVFAVDGQRFERHTIYIAPPDHHLLIEEDRLLVKKGPKENRFRPSVDALFRSAAYNYGPRVIGIILSGLLDDGTSGLWSIKRLGGVVLIQDPKEAIFSSMPESVLQYVSVDEVVSVGYLPIALQQLMNEPIEPKALDDETALKNIKKEILIASQKNALEMGVMKLGPLTPFTCPECHGTLVSIKEGAITRYRCHTGHAYSSTALLAEVTKSVEESLGNTLRGMEETILLLETKGAEREETGDAGAATQFYRKALQIRQQAEEIRSIINKHELLSEERLKGDDY